MKKKLPRMYLYLGNNDYGRIERELTTYVSGFLFGRNLQPDKISYLDWDIYGLQLCKKTEETIWISYHALKCAQYFPNRMVLIIDEFTMSFFDSPAGNMVLMDQPNWVHIVNNYLEMK